MISQADNLLLQSYYSVLFLVELRNNKLLESQYFKDMEFGVPWVKKAIESIGIDNQGSLLMSLYAMLVIPKELIFEKYPEKVNNIQRFLRSNCIIKRNDYNSDKDDIDCLRHIRNAVSHAKVEFDPQETVTFTDTNFRSKKTIVLELPLRLVDSLLLNLQELHLMHIRANQNRQEDSFQ